MLTIPYSASKVCPSCEILTPSTDYYAHSKLGSPQGRCKECLSDYYRSRYATDASFRARNRARTAAHPQQPLTKAESRTRHTFWNHGLTMERFAEILASQAGGCAICGTKNPGGRGSFHVDHDHACCPKGKSCDDCRRGLLCTNCNVGLGMLGDTADGLARALGYLLTHDGPSGVLT